MIEILQLPDQNPRNYEYIWSGVWRFQPPSPYGLRGGRGGGQERAGLRGLLGPGLHPNLDTKTLQNPESPGLKH